MTRFTPVLTLGIAIMLAAAAAHADTAQATAVEKKWKTSDRCARQAQIAFPDHTAEANAKRDESLKACLEGGALPPREPLSPGHGPGAK